ncbi:unnamed protein product [Linum tenue]|uniref:Uncharacterized protein n=1 Tax=Linum tenue TaxID=586396 RepID=A0AAV0LHB4_9ROSI|nr:unnamed protein product [Linum tenue]
MSPFSFLFSVILQPQILKVPIVVFSPKIHPNSLLSFHQELPLLGSSFNGSYQKLILDDTVSLAIKRLNPSKIGGGGGSRESQSKSSLNRETQHQLELLVGLKHRNQLELLAVLDLRSKDWGSVDLGCG